MTMGEERGMGDQERIRSAWDCLASEEEKGKRLLTNYSGLKSSHELHNYLVTGRRDYHYLDYFRDKYLAGRSPLRIASLGCGDGGLERTLAGEFSYPYREIEGFDINPKLIEFAAQEATKRGLTNLHYRVMDLNRPALGESSYDLVVFFHSLHHLEALEEALDAVLSSLTEEGLLLVVDYTGPSRLQCPEKVLKIAQELLDLLPRELKVNLAKPSSPVLYKERVTRKSVREVVGADPSEAVRSDEIVPLIEERFQVLEKRPMGGTVIEQTLGEIAGNFDESNPVVRSLLLSFQKVEEIALREGGIDPHYTFLVARKGPPGSPRTAPPPSKVLPPPGESAPSLSFASFENDLQSVNNLLQRKSVGAALRNLARKDLPEEGVQEEWNTLIQGLTALEFPTLLYNVAGYYEQREDLPASRALYRVLTELFEKGDPEIAGKSYYKRALLEEGGEKRELLERCLVLYPDHRAALDLIRSLPGGENYSVPTQERRPDFRPPSERLLAPMFSEHHLDLLESIQRRFSLRGKNVVDVGGVNIPAELMRRLGVRRFVCVDPVSKWGYGCSDGKCFEKPVYKRKDFREAFEREFSFVLDEGIEEVGEELASTFDVAISIGAFEHVASLEQTLEALFRILKKDGHLFSYYDPIFSCAKGHHVYINKNYNFNNMPELDHMHLLYGPEEARRYLQGVERFEGLSETIVQQAYFSDKINRFTLNDHLRALSGGPFNEYTILFYKVTPVPPQRWEELVRRHGPMRYDVQGIQYVARKL